LNILIAEDNAINRNVAVGTLNKLGYSMEKITVAFDGAEAISQYRASLDRPLAQRFNAILMDIWMPNMDGYEATTNIVQLADEKGETVKIIAVTADITGDSLERAKAVGMQGFLTKPYKVLDMENLIVENFRRRTKEMD
jgi:CheY-like chemotaxis protein